MNTTIKNIFIIGLLFLLPACEDKIDPLIEELQVERVFSPLELKAQIRNKTTVELSWKLRNDAESYVVEISEGNLDFSTIIKTATVTSGEVPYRVTLDGETQYSARVKGTAADLEDSKWSTVTFTTEAENIFEPLAGTDIQATSVTLKWPAGSDVTHFIINPGNTERVITDQEKEAGTATITGLTGETEYTIKMLRGTKQRGLVTFTTLIDIGDATPVEPDDDLNAIITAAAEGDVLVLWPGDYLAYTGSITLNKSISIKGLYPYNKPIIHVQFILGNNVQTVEIKDLEMDGTYIDPQTLTENKLDNSFHYPSIGSYGSLNVVGCHIHDYQKSLFSSSTDLTISASIESITVDNCVVTNILTDGSDGIDFRYAYVAKLSLKNSTFNNCAPGRDLVRLDDSSGTFPGKVSDVLIDHCTIYGASNNTSRRILYVRFVNNTLKVTNTIIAATVGTFTNQSKSAQPECSNNNYFNAPGFYTPGYISGVKLDISGNYTTLDPGFTGVANGNFTVTNQTLLDNQVGDPRWLTAQ
ncbi:MAG: DUF5123 domain-containing protein [Mangrovibacterium sp.]